MTTTKEVVVVGRLEKQAAEWRAIGAPSMVMGWIQHGVELHLEGQPVEDGRSFPLTTSQKEWLDVEILRLLEVGAIEHLGPDQGLMNKPPGVILCAPVFLVPKKGPKKWRLVIDLRRLNEVLEDRPCKFENISTLARMAGRGWWLLTFDLAQGYHHVSMADSAKGWMAFRINGQWFRYRVLPFGLKWSPWIFTKLTRVMLQYWRSLGVMITAYMDDFSAVAPTKDELLMVRDTIIAPTLERLGWVRETTKGQWEPVQAAEVLGFQVDLLAGRLYIPKAKLRNAEVICKQPVGRMLSKKELASLVGVLSSLKKAAPLIQLYLREAYMLIGRPRTQQGWKSQVQLTQAVVSDLAWIGSHLRELHGSPLWRPSRVLVMKTDAAGMNGWGAYLKEMAAWARGAHTPEEASWYIHQQELYAVLMGIQAFGLMLAGRMVECEVDSTVALTYLANGGGKDPWMNQLTRRIHQELQAIGASLYKAIWIRGSQNHEADLMSRWVDQDDWQLRDSTIYQIRQAFGSWQVDRFADHLNARAKLFNSVFHVPGTTGVDAFSQDWGGQINLLVPPLYLIMRVLQHLVEGQATGILVVPFWEAQPWWPILLRVSVEWIPLGTGWEMAEPGPSGSFEPGRRGSWQFQAHLVHGSRFQGWRDY
jgi:Reverse transcriptase (RNA-dependent DNA polymerase)